jgi:hypothetical protein
MYENHGPSGQPHLLKGKWYISGAGQGSEWPQPYKVRVRVSGVLGHGDQRLPGWSDLLEFGDDYSL